MAVAGTLSAQAVSVGVLGGVPFTDANRYGGESRPFMIGPSVEVGLPANFAIEADALYRRIGSTTSFSILQGSGLTSVVNSNVDRERGNSWQFPLLGKYYFGSQAARWRPFVGSGFSLRIANQDFTSTTTTTVPTGIQTSVFHTHEGSGLGVGATVAAGLRYQRGRIAVLPQLRYTRWSDNANNLTQRNEGAFLLEITF